MVKLHIATQPEKAMKYILLVVALMLAACDKPATPKIAAPQREALDKAKAVEQVIKQSADETKQKADEAGK